MFNSTRFALARKRRGITKRALAERIEVSERSVSAYECGATIPEPETVNRISRVLGFPVAFFCASDVDELKPDIASFRALTKMTSSQRAMALGAGSIALLLSEWIEQRFDLPQTKMPDFDRNGLRASSISQAAPRSDQGDLYPAAGEEHDPEAYSDALRHYWGLGELPIRNMISLLESNGIRVFSLAIDAREVDAFSMWYGGKPYVFLNTNKTAERCRFDAAHELGHLIMHRHGAPQGQEAERDANAFASAFLMPRKSILANAPRSATLPSLIAHKKYWTVSAAALNYRLHSLGLTTDWTYRTLCVQLSQYGRNKEPDGSSFETSQVLSKVFAALRAEGVSKNDVASELMVLPQEIDELTFGLMLTALGGRKDRDLIADGKSARRPNLTIVK